MNLVLDAIKSSHHQCGECEIRIGGGVWESNLNPPSFRAVGVGYPDRGRAVADRVGQINWRFKTGY